ncbi:hypothetical protein BDV96DRAFT_470477, partial [Lophiotrema nucula]
MRDELLEQDTRLALLFACVEEIMPEECLLYKQEKSRWPDSRAKDDIKKWERFVGVASAGNELKNSCLAPITKACAFWDRKRVQHYRWFFAGEKFCKLLGTAVARNPDWEGACIKLNRLILRTISLPGRHNQRASANPVRQIDLKDLKKWTTEDNFEKDGTTLTYEVISAGEIPDGYVIDSYGLV